MYTLSCRNKHIQAIQCLHGQLGGTLATALATGRGDTSCLVKRVNIIRAYLRILYCHWAPTKEMNHLSSISIDALSVSLTIDQTTVAGGLIQYSSAGVTNYIVGLEAILDMFDADPNISGNIVGNKLYIWSSSPDAPVYSNLTNITIEELTNSTEDFLLKKNCLTDSQINDIITSAYKVLETESGCGCS